MGIIHNIQSTPLNRVTLVPEHFDPIKRRFQLSGVILYYFGGSVLGHVTRLTGGPSLTGDPIKRSRLYIIN